MAILLAFWLTVISVCSSASIRKVAIIGSGPGGLGLAASLKHFNSVGVIDVFESRPSVTQPSQGSIPNSFSDIIVEYRIGGGLQLSGGALVLEKIGLFNKLEKQSLPLNRVFSRDQEAIKILDINLGDEIKSSGKILRFRSIMRDALQQILYEASKTKSPSKTSTKVNFLVNKRLSLVEEYASSNGNKVSLKFEDKSSYDDYDLVIGADGVRSTVKNFVVNQRQNFFDKLIMRNRYEGIRITFVVTDADKGLKLRPSNDSNSFHQWYVVPSSFASFAHHINILGLEMVSILSLQAMEDSRECSTC